MQVQDCPKCGARFSGELTLCPIDGTELVAPSDPFIGRTIAGRYLVEEQLGSGGMGAVYRARHQFIGRDVALKFLDPSLTRNERLRKRFLGEARAANQINHEHIIDINDFGETEDGLVYMVMEYLDGHSLDEEIERGQLEVRRALRIALQVAKGLGRAHELGVVHRDIKPGNIYLTRRRGDPDFVKILDFGVARIEHDARITAKNMIVGTPEYIAPEQIRQSGATLAADLYSLGCVLFEMLTGRLPFEGKTTILLVKHINDPPPVPSSLRPDLPTEVDLLILKLLAKKPEDRHRDAYHLSDELRALLDALPKVRASGGVHSSQPSAPRAPVENEEERWERTAQLYEELLREVHPQGGAPDWLGGGVRSMHQLVVDLRGLRAQLDEAAAKATEQEQQVREPREQIGRALDELATDESKLARHMLEIEGELRPADSALDAATHAVLASIQALSPREVGQVVSAEDFAALTQARRMGAELASARDHVAGLRARLQRKRDEHRDVRFQISELKQKLGTLHEASTFDKEIWDEEVNRLSGQIHSKLETIARIADRVSQYFRQYPELRARLSDHPTKRDAPSSSEVVH